MGLRTAASRLIELAGIDFLAHRVNAGKLAVLCYHGVVAERMSRRDANFETTIGVSDFAAHLEFLVRWFHPVTLSEVRASFVEGKPLPRRSLLVTLDDGYRNALTHGAPALLRYGVPAAVFVSTGYIGGKLLYWYDEIARRLDQWSEPRIESPVDGKSASWPKEQGARRALAREIEQACKRIPNRRRIEYLEYVRARTPEGLELTEGQHHVLDPMNWDEVRSLAALGFEIGSHTVTHPILTNLEPDDLHEELVNSKAEIERQTGKPCFSISYPNGARADYSNAVVEATRAAGYVLGFTLAERLDDHRNGPYLISRIGVPGHVPLTALRIRASGLHAMLKGTGAPG
jgi:peptidoglycan/xylan/chitin deacetylase (PgdA/CDA1 family)